MIRAKEDKQQGDPEGFRVTETSWGFQSNSFSGKGQWSPCKATDLPWPAQADQDITIYPAGGSASKFESFFMPLIFLKIHFMGYGWFTILCFRCTAKYFSHKYTHIHSFLDSFLIQFIIEYWVEPTVLCSRSLLVIYLTYSSAWMFGTSLVVQTVKNHPAMWETWVWSLGWEDHWCVCSSQAPNLSLPANPTFPFWNHKFVVIICKSVSVL